MLLFLLHYPALSMEQRTYVVMCSTMGTSGTGSTVYRVVMWSITTGSSTTGPRKICFSTGWQKFHLLLSTMFCILFVWIYLVRFPTKSKRWDFCCLVPIQWYNVSLIYIWANTIALLCVKTLNASNERCTFQSHPLGPHCEDAYLQFFFQYEYFVCYTILSAISQQFCY